MSDEKVQKPTRNRLLIILSIITLVSIIFFIASTCYICSRDGFKKEIKIVQDGTTIDSLEIKSLNMHPGEIVNYQVVLNSTASGNYEVVMNFKEKEDGGLKNFIIVTIMDGNKEILNKKLSEVFTDGKIKMNCNITAFKSYVIDIKYTMPVETGNDAMSTNASFDIEFTIDMV
ncbi:MAG: hypothetical protein IKA85_06115 [Clostridia bacterium]|nr:hypothetical protein [Clostridia bacterium]